MEAKLVAAPKCATAKNTNGQALIVNLWSPSRADGTSVTASPAPRRSAERRTSHLTEDATHG
jgi:hypothetical protein